MKSILGIIGAGVLGQHIAHYATLTRRYSKVLFFDDIINIGTENNYGTVIGRISDVGGFIQASKIHNLIVGIGYKHMMIRKQIFEQFESLINFPNIIHKTCFVDKTVQIGSGNVLLPACIIDKGCILGNNIFFNPGCIIAHDNCIDDHCFFAPRVTTSGFVKIGEACFLGTGMQTINNIKINNNIIIGAGTVVDKDLETCGTYIGIPARKLH
jgi:sugar O-acyltransferase (sialic acid O-acetyltransferase NeuD family)